MNIRILTIIFFLIISCKRQVVKVETSLREESSMMVDGLDRKYILNLPPKYNDSTGFALVIAMHGGGGQGSQMEKDYLLTEKANKSQFAIVYPNGVQSDGLLGARTYNAGTCCDYAVEKQVDDVKFISTLIDKILLKYPKIDPKKVYATGMSNGAMMCYRLACEIPQKIAAIAPVAGAQVVTKPCNASKSVAVLHLHSELDKNVPFNGGLSGFGFKVAPVMDGINNWIANNKCLTSSKRVENFPLYSKTSWSGCTNSGVELYFTKDGGHSWPGGTKNRALADDNSKAINANDVMWEFFKKYKLP